MYFRGSEDRLNPLTPAGVSDTTLGGYLAVHGRAAAFEGADGEPYTVAVEAEPGEEPADGWVAYLVFLRWSHSGTTIMGHLDTGDLASGPTEAEARAALESLPLARVKAILDEEIWRRRGPAPEPTR